MWRTPVTLGGGMTMQKGSPSGFTSGRKAPDPSQTRIPARFHSPGVVASLEGVGGAASHGGDGIGRAYPTGARRLRAPLAALLDITDGQQGGVGPILDHLAVDYHPPDVRTGGKFIHGVEEYLFHDGPQTTGARAP